MIYFEGRINLSLLWVFDWTKNSTYLIFDDKIYIMRLSWTNEFLFGGMIIKFNSGF